MTMGPRITAAVLLLCLLPPARAEKTYDPGASDIEIKVGNFAPATGVFAEYGMTARAEAAYFKMLNDQGGINGRKITFISLDSESRSREGAAPGAGARGKGSGAAPRRHVGRAVERRHPRLP